MEQYHDSDDERAGPTLSHQSPLLPEKLAAEINDVEDSDDYELATLLNPDERLSSEEDLIDDMENGITRTGSSKRRRASSKGEGSIWNPFRRGWRIVKRRPILSSFALLATLITLLLLLFLSSVEDAEIAEYLSWFKNNPDPTSSHPAEEEEEWEDPTKPQRMKTMDTITDGCLEAWIARGTLCSPMDGLIWMRRSMSRTQLDAVWTWVNGSDPRHELSRSFWTKQPVNSAIYEIDPPEGWNTSESDYQRIQPHIHADPTTLAEIGAANNETRSLLAAHAKGKRATKDPLSNTKNGKWFRDHDELKYSMRGVKTHLEALRTMHILATDFRHPFQEPALPPPPPPPTIPGIGENETVTNTTAVRSRRADAVNWKQTEQGDVDGDAVDYRAVGFTDWIETPDDLTGGGMREGQWPQWMDPTVLFDEDGNEVANASVRIQHHWNVYNLPNDTGRDLTNWKNRVLPSFDSYAIETQLMNLDGLHEVFIYNNDDFFVLKDVAASDFYTPLYGQVFRLKATSGVDAMKNDHADASGELPQLHRSAWVIGERFGQRQMHRPYIVHATKTYALPILKEARLMFPEEFARTSEHRFRGLGQDVVAIFLANHMTVERHREALLWSFLVARGDKNGNGWVEHDELEELVQFLGQSVVGKWKGQTTVLDVRSPQRMTTSAIGPILEAVGMKSPQQTTIMYTSQDGYPYYRPQGESLGWPKIYGKTWNPKICTLDLQKCLPEYFDEKGEGLGVNTLMKRWAFEKTDCGDCTLMQLTGLSGGRGMSAFLPPNNTYFPAAQAQHSNTSSLESNSTSSLPVNRADGLLDLPANSTNSPLPPYPSKPPPVAYLPIGPTWNGLNYTPAAVEEMTGWPADRTRREFAMRLIQRYAYSIGVSPFYFAMLERPRQALADLRKITRNRPALVCINDDIVEGRDTIDEAFEEWLQQTFTEPLPFERP